MEIIYLFASPQGDARLNQEMLERPFLLEPFQPHPFMLLEDYFVAIKDFILQKNGVLLIGILSRIWGRQVALSDIKTILIRYEKYGALYQIGSVEIIGAHDKSKFGTSMALTPNAKAQMALEYEIIEELNKGLDIRYLPEMYLKTVIRVERNDITETVVISLFEWFEGYHEWHVKKDDDGRERIVIWDLQNGNRFATDKQAHDIIQGASKILTLHYNIQTCNQIFPWHHGAGDFVVKLEEDKVDVRLITVRGYRPLVLYDAHEFVDPLKALVLFFLSLTVKMRIDKDEGMGGPVWADSITPLPVIDGLLEGLRLQENRGMCPPNGEAMVRHVLKDMDMDEIKAMLYSQLNSYKHIDPVDSEVITGYLDRHAEEVFQAIKEI
ncbi:MAG: hypothetical protein U9N82_13030 [Thermodesulfobacteriota bacterium]|nr:hypothetical protein [Thermodesulfobacteriota bacterium]